MEEVIVQKRTPCEIYSRVVGYFRPVAQWNPGKQSEFNDRVLFTVKGITKKKKIKK